MVDVKRTNGRQEIEEAVQKIAQARREEQVGETPDGGATRLSPPAYTRMVEMGARGLLMARRYFQKAASIASQYDMVSERSWLEDVIDELDSTVIASPLAGAAAKVKLLI